VADALTELKGLEGVTIRMKENKKALISLGTCNQFVGFFCGPDDCICGASEW
jgi:hypothetical protein